MMPRFSLKRIAMNLFIIFCIMSITSAEENASAVIDIYSGNSHITNTNDRNESTFRKDHISSVMLNACSYQFKDIRKRWYHQSRKLQLYLTKLKERNCNEFYEECKLEHFAVSTYTKMVYKRLCDFASFQNECVTKFHEFGISPNETESSLGNRIGEIIVKSFEDKTNGLRVLSEPCIQALFEAARFTDLAFAYREIKDEQIPFCDTVWTSLPSTAYKIFNVSMSFFMVSRCRTSLLVFLGFIVALSICVIVGNTLVILVLQKLKKNANSQWVFKMSLAVADLLTGAFSLPGWTIVVAHYFFGYFWVTEKRHVVYPTLPYKFLQAVGFFTLLPLIVSVYSLLLASFDRFMVVFRPLKYEKFKALRISKLSVFILWTLSLIFASLPFMIDSFKYELHGVVVSSSGKSAIIVYSIMLVVPVLTMWILNIGTFCFYRSNARKTSTGRRFHRKHDCSESDKRLLKTLSVMVGAFTFCLLSLIVSMWLGMYGFTASHDLEFDGNSSFTSSTIEAIGLYIMMSNSLWNFFIYNVRSLEFRSTLSQMFFDIKKIIDIGLRNQSGRRISSVAPRTTSYWLASHRSSSAE